MNAEWEAWQGVITELRLLHPGVELNDPDGPLHPLFGAIRRWGEELVALRAGQDPAVVARALTEMRAAYPLAQ